MAGVKQKYFNPKLSGSYSGLKSFIKNRKISNSKEVKSQVEKLKEYYLFKPIRRKFPRRRVLVHEPKHQIAFDLIDLIRYSKWNNNFKYVLIVVDVFTKKIWTEKLKSKSADALVIAFKRLFTRMGCHPKLAQSDDGKEFVNSKVQSLFKAHNIKWFSTRSIVKAGVAERAIRTIMSKLARVFSHRDNFKYIDVLDNIVKSYNDSVHSTIGMKPNEVVRENTDLAYFNTYKDIIKDKRKRIPKFKVGDQVRIDRQKAMFEKGYDYNWNPEIFVVEKVSNSTPITYNLKDLNGEQILGTFYEPELQKVI